MTNSIHPVTQLASRAALESALQSLVGRQEDVALAMLDLDGFEEVNVDFGQAVGDDVLRMAATLLKEADAGDLFQVGGDEFALVMPGSSLEQAFLLAERVRNQIEGAAQRFGLPDGRAVRLTVGVAQYPRDAKDVRGLLKSASAALAAAKEAGRNQVGLPPNEDMVLKSCYYPASSLRRLKALAERKKRKESQLLREALDDLFHKYDTPREA